MTESIIITIIADDRPGIVSQLSDIIHAHQANWQESSLSHLGGEFAGLIRITVDESNKQALLNELKDLDKQSIEVSCRLSKTTDNQDDSLKRFSITGNDRQGIVEEISGVLSSKGVNLEKLETSCDAAPMAGDMIFTANILAYLPSTMSEKDLQEALEKLSDDLIVEYDA